MMLAMCFNSSVQLGILDSWMMISENASSTLILFSMCVEFNV